MQFEWAVHNMAYVGASILGFEKEKGQAGSVDFGKTLFADNHKGTGLLMKASYFVHSPVTWLIDLIIQLGGE